MKFKWLIKHVDQRRLIWNIQVPKGSVDFEIRDMKVSTTVQSDCAEKSVD